MVADTCRVHWVWINGAQAYRPRVVHPLLPTAGHHVQQTGVLGAEL